MSDSTKDTDPEAEAQAPGPDQAEAPAPEPKTMRRTMEEVYDRIQRDAEAEDRAEEERRKAYEMLSPKDRRARRREEMGAVYDKHHPEEAAARAARDAAAAEKHGPWTPDTLPPEWNAEAKVKFLLMPEHLQRLTMDQWRAAGPTLVAEAPAQERAAAAAPPSSGALDPNDAGPRWGAYLGQLGTTADQAFDYLMGADYVLRTADLPTKRALLLEIARDYGVDIFGNGRLLGTPRAVPGSSAYGGADGALPPDPIHPRHYDEAGRVWERFASDTVNGSAKYPFATELSDDMAALIEMGHAVSLEDAYRAALRANPHIQARVNEQAARSAPKRSSSPDAKKLNGRTPPRPKTIRQTLEETYDRIHAREAAKDG